MNILLVDDDEAYRKSLKLRLEGQGHIAFEAADGVEALERLNQEKIHAIVADTLMPRMDAVQLCYEIRKIRRFEKLPIILYSAILATPEDEKTARESGADYFFTKPIPERVIVESLRDLLFKKQKYAFSARRTQKKSKAPREYSARLVERLERRTAELRARTLELERSELLFRTLANSAPAAIFIYRRDKILYGNPAAEALTGYTAERLLTMRLLDIVHPESRDLVREQAFTVGRTPSSFQFRILTKQGKDRSVDFTACVIDYGDEQAIVGIVCDVTDRKLAEHALRESEDRYRRLVEASPDAVIVHTEGKLVYANQAGAKLLGASHANELIGKSIWDFVHEGSKEKVRRRIKQMTKEGKGVPLTEEKFVTVDGRTVDVEVVGVPFTYKGNLVIQVIARDITDRKQAEEDLHKSEEKYRALFDESKDVVYISTAEGRLLDINAAGVEVLGYASKEELLHIDIGRDAYAVPEQRQRFQMQMEQQGFVKDFEIIVKRKDGEKLAVLDTATAVRDKQGKVIMYRGIMRDVTKQRQLEQQVAQAQRMESLGALAGGIAHDFNNILGIILGHASQLERAQKDAALFGNATAAITKAVQRGANLVRQILTFARKTEVAVQPTDVNSVITELSKMLRETFPRTITISLQLDKSIPLVTLDQSQFYQALLNLCINARDAMLDPEKPGQAAGTLTIVTESIDDRETQRRFHNASASHYVRITVSDTGVGMAETTRHRIFEPFFTTKEAGSGTGLGLAVVYGVVQSHNGFIDVETELGKGTSFQLYFPASEVAQPSLQRKKGEEEDLLGGTETILLVEDEKQLLDLLRSVLEDKGYHVVTAEDGFEAIEKYMRLKEKIALVLTDIGLPRLDGATVFWALREINPGLRIILASGYLEPQLKSELLKAGAMEFVQKPYEADVILRKIREVLDRTS